jgi:hypothetical protein
MKETEICAAAVSRMRSEGWTVHCEVNVFGRPADIVGRLGDDLMIVEAKRSFSGSLKDQLLTAKSIADYIVAVVGTKPNVENLEWCDKFGFGVWIASGLELWEILAPRRSVNHYTWSRTKTIQMFEAMESRGATNVGGSPTQAGIGPAIECSERVKQFFAEHPGSSWKLIYESVPNHYASAASMASAMRRHGLMEFMDQYKKGKWI